MTGAWAVASQLPWLPPDEHLNLVWRLVSTKPTLESKFVRSRHRLLMPAPAAQQHLGSDPLLLPRCPLLISIPSTLTHTIDSTAPVPSFSSAKEKGSQAVSLLQSLGHMGRDRTLEGPASKQPATLPACLPPCLPVPCCSASLPAHQNCQTLTARHCQNH